MSTDVVRLGRCTLDIREKAVVHEYGYLLQRSGDKLGEAFVITQLAEELITVDDDELSS